MEYKDLKDREAELDLDLIEALRDSKEYFKISCKNVLKQIRRKQRLCPGDIKKVEKLVAETKEEFQSLFDYIEAKKSVLEAQRMLRDNSNKR